MIKNRYLIIVSCFVSIFFIYIFLFIHTYINLNKEFLYSFKSLENLNFHEKYSKKIHHIREEPSLDLLFKESNVEDLLFTRINKIDEKDITVLFQGDSWMEQLTFSITGNFKSSNRVLEFKSKKNVDFINAGTGSYSPSLMNLQLDLLENDFKVAPNIVIAYIDQSDIGDENCRYKNHKIYKNGSLDSIKPESYLMYTDVFNYSKIYGLSRIALNASPDFVKTFQLINFKFKYNISKSTIRFYRRYISNLKTDQDKLKKCYWSELERYLIEPTTENIEYFSQSIYEYINKVNEKKHIEKLFLVTFPHKKHFNKNLNKGIKYTLNVSDVVDEVVKNTKNVTHINFSKILLDNRNFDPENSFRTDNIHLKYDVHSDLFIKKILEELHKYLQT